MARGFYASNIDQLPPDALFGIKEKYNKDPRDFKVDLSLGAYRDNDGKPWILPSVRLAENLLQNSADYNHEYLPIKGLQALTTAAAGVIFGEDSPAIAENRVVSIQSLSGTGSLHIAGDFLYRFYQEKGVKGSDINATTVYLPDPTWANHVQIFEANGLKVAKYPYWDTEKKCLKIKEFVAAIKAAPQGSVILLHATAQNPTGMDPTHEEWLLILDAISESGHLPLFDCAYQGFTTGDLAEDAWSVRKAVSGNYNFPGIVVCQSFAKNCGMYGERVGAFHIVLPEYNAAFSSAVSSQLAKIMRSEVSNPPAYGAKVVTLVLTKPELRQQWEKDLITMSSRIRLMRQAVLKELQALGTPGDWTHITKQRGMFSFTGLAAEEVDHLAEEYGVYMARNGRISLAGLNDSNVKYFSKCVDEVVRKHRGVA